MFCTECGTQNSDSSRFCTGCGKKLIAEAGASIPIQEDTSKQTAYRPRGTITPKPSGSLAQNKTPVLAGVLSFLLTGVGQFYNGDIKKGAFMLGGALLLLFIFPFLAIPVWIYSIIDAYQVAEGKKPLWT